MAGGPIAADCLMSCNGKANKVPIISLFSGVAGLDLGMSKPHPESESPKTSAVLCTLGMMSAVTAAVSLTFVAQVDSWCFLCDPQTTQRVG